MNNTLFVHTSAMQWRQLLIKQSLFAIILSTKSRALGMHCMGEVICKKDDLTFLTVCGNPGLQHTVRGKVVLFANYFPWGAAQFAAI